VRLALRAMPGPRSAAHVTRAAKKGIGKMSARTWCAGCAARRDMFRPHARGWVVLFVARRGIWRQRAQTASACVGHSRRAMRSRSVPREEALLFRTERSGVGR
jgi:hypothetical protein